MIAKSRGWPVWASEVEQCKAGVRKGLFVAEKSER